MATRTLVTPDEYLHMVFDGPDREFVDGEVVERGMPTYSHGQYQTRVVEIFYELRKSHPLFAVTEVRHQLHGNLFRIPDVAIHFGKRPSEQIPSTPPFAVVEIISPDDRYTNIVRKLREYAEWGVPHIWVIDPEEQTLSVFQDALRPVSLFEIPELGVTISKAEIFPAE
ncbi:MAG: Uma2 family endonuclease [Bryobacteraceae bacterium]|nr:Uma2 family endonuclease [Bryobacteraceae bacterium]